MLKVVLIMLSLNGLLQSVNNARTNGDLSGIDRLLRAILSQFVCVKSSVVIFSKPEVDEDNNHVRFKS